MKHFKILSLTALVLLLAGCYPGGPEYYDQIDLVFTNYDAQYNFAAKKTYAIPDQIMKIDDQLLAGGDPTFVKDTYAVPMLAQINTSMTNNGWTRVNKNSNPDVTLAPVAYELTTYSYYGGYWGGWYGGWYGWYYPYPVVTSYSTGSLIVNMVDPNDLSADGKAHVAWTFVINGLLEGSSVDFTTRFTKGINQAFVQSPYLKK